MNEYEETENRRDCRFFFSWRKNMNHMNHEKSYLDEKDLEKIVEFIESVKFGSVNIIIQDGKIIQIERNEKLRLRKN